VTSLARVVTVFRSAAARRLFGAMREVQWAIRFRATGSLFRLTDNVLMYTMTVAIDRRERRLGGGIGLCLGGERLMRNGELPAPRGRGARINPGNRFECTRHELELDQLEVDDDYIEVLGRPPTEYFTDTSRSIIAENDSPDVGFEVSINPYRGCEHGCIYCYARPTHEYLGFSAGLDFETKI